MKTKATQFIYQDTAIHFALSNNKNVMINATEMAKAFNKRIDRFTKSEHAKSFIERLQNKIEHTPNGGRSTSKAMDKLNKKQKIIACFGKVNIKSTAKMCKTSESYVTTVRCRFGLSDKTPY